MILVTGGTTMPFNELFVEVDRLTGLGVLDTPVLCQVGRSDVRLQHAERMTDLPAPAFAALIARASLVITHAGATVIQLIMSQKPFVAFPNPRGAGKHQLHFLARVSTVADISWSEDVRDMEALVRARQAKGAVSVHANVPRAQDEVRRIVMSLGSSSARAGF